MNEVIEVTEIITKVTQTAVQDAAWSVIGKLSAIYVAAAVLLSVVNYVLATHTNIGRDDSDPPAGRSDMKVMTDHLTGCQYLMSSRGGLTPRLDENGKQICLEKGGAALAPRPSSTPAVAAA